jgi:ankyrin repeat protein
MTNITFDLDSGPCITGLDSLVRFYQERADGLVCVLSMNFVRGHSPPVDVQCCGTSTTLHRACQKGHIDVVRAILSPEYIVVRPDINSKDQYGSTALHHASYFGHDDIVRLLIQAGAHVLVRDAHGATALHQVKIIEKHTNTHTQTDR